MRACKRVHDKISYTIGASLLCTLLTTYKLVILCEKMANIKQQLAALVNSSGPSQKDRIEKYDMLCCWHAHH